MTEIRSGHLISDEIVQLIYSVAEQTLNGIILTNEQQEIIYVNKAFTLSTGYTMEEVLGKNPRFLQSGIHDVSFYSHLWNCITTTGSWQGEIWNKRKNGELFAEWQNIMTFRNKQNEVTHYAAVFSDITERKLVELELLKRNNELAKMALSDALTGLANRYLFTTELELAWIMATNAHQPVALLMIDIDYFKLYNDTYGHLKGDHCLKQVAAIIQKVCSEREYLAARFGGEEFIVLVAGENALEASQTAEIIRQEVEHQKILHEASLTSSFVTVSIGCASYIPEYLETPELLISLADKALYNAKETGRNRISF